MDDISGDLLALLRPVSRYQPVRPDKPALGIDRVYGKCYVFGRSLLALVLTFALTEGEAKRLSGPPGSCRNALRP
jgi:hypothetical protein